jgi:hypothetical protein
MAFAKRNQGAPAPSTPSAAPKVAPTPAQVQVNPQQDELITEGFVFDPLHFPFTLLQTLVAIAKEIRELGLTKTGGKNSDDREIASKAKYAYFEEAEIVSYLVPLLEKHKIGYAAGTSRITGRFVAGQTQYGGTQWSMHVRCAAIFSHAETKEWIIVPGVGESFDSGDKAVTKAITSAIKYIIMKTFLISDGNDIEVEQGSQVGENNLKAPEKKQSKSRTTTNLKCADCSKQIKGGKYRGTQIDAPSFAEATKGFFGRQICADCVEPAKEKLNTPSTPAATTAPANGKAKPTEQGQPLSPLDTTLVNISTRLVKKGTPKESSVYDLNLFGGIKVTDFHKSHYDLYNQIMKEKATNLQIKLVYEESQNGQYVNRNLKALMELDGECYEDEQGNDLPLEGVAEEESEGYDAHNDTNPITDDDIPF